MNQRKVMMAATAISAILAVVWVSYSPALPDAPNKTESNPGGLPSNSSPAVAPRAPITNFLEEPRPQAERQKERPANIDVGSLLRAGSDWKKIFDDLDTMPNVSARDRLFYKAVIMESCANYAGVLAADTPVIKAIKNGALEEYKRQATRGVSDPRRVEAIKLNADRNIANVCRGFAEAKISEADVDAAYRTAAAAGDLRAQARVINQRLVEAALASAGQTVPEEFRALAANQPPGFKGGVPPPLTSAERDQLMAALFSGDPVAIRTAGSVLSLQAAQQSLRVGPDLAEIGHHSGYVWTLVACEFGLDCGAQNLLVSASCSEVNRCSDSFFEFLQMNLPGPELEQVRATAQLITDAIRRRDYSAIQLVEKPGTHLTLVSSVNPVRIR